MVAVAPLGAATVDAKRSFDLPRGDAATTLRQFAAAAGRSLVFVTDKVRGETTNAVRGDFAPREALDRMLAGSALEAAQDAATGALVVSRKRTASRAGEVEPVSNPSPQPSDPMKKPRSRALTALLTFVSAGLQAQSPNADALKPEKSEPIHLTAFEVVGDSDKSYGAINSNSITRFNTELSKLPVSADILTQTFMADVAAVSVEDLIVGYHAGSGMSYSDAGSATTQPGDRNAESAVQIRGLYTPTMQRDGFLPLWTYSTSSTTGTGYTSNFDIERVELIKGPQSLLYGSGGGGGVVNTVSKQARLGQRRFGSFTYKVDQFGSKSGQFDFGVGTHTLALRVAAVSESMTSRRVDIGGDLEGYYVQLAYRPFQNTLIRLTGQKTLYDSTRSSNVTLNAQNAAFDRRHGQFLHYLLATNQLERSASGPSGAGVIANGHLNWNNVDSFGGWLTREETRNSFAILTAETKWNAWLFTQFAVGYKDFIATNRAPVTSMVAPTVTANPLREWAMAASGSSDVRATLTKAIRFSAMADHSLFRGRVKSQSILGVDYSRTEPSIVSYGYFRADSGLNIIRTAAGVPTGIPTRYYSIQQGHVASPLNSPGAPVVEVGGVSYVNGVANLPDGARIAPNNPLGVRLGAQSYYMLKLLNRGFYGANYLSWFDGRVNTLVGFRLASLLQESLFPGVVPTVADPNTYATKLVQIKDKLSYQFGTSYQLLPWLTPYVSLSSSFNPAVAQRNDPYGDIPQSAEAHGHEAGFKFSGFRDRISGSIAYFSVNSKMEQIRTETTIQEYINPEGLNGTYRSPSLWLNADRKVKGVDVALTASPTSNWRLRVSSALTDGKIGTTKSYAQLYNDQFYQNNQGQVTYRDGAVVFVRPTYIASQHASQPTVPEGTASAIPLTIAMMSSPGNSYYANPTPVTGQISSSSAAAQVLRWVDPARGPILTGVAGLPISRMQINPGFTPPGMIPATVAGDVTTGYPKYSLNLTSMHTVSRGLAKGLRLGGTVGLSWQHRGHYFYPGGVGVDSNRTLFFRPDRRRVDFMLGYERRMERFTWSTQVNVQNAFNHYDWIVLPSSVTGFAGILNATFSEQPRSYVWTNTIKF